MDVSKYLFNAIINNGYSNSVLVWGACDKTDSIIEKFKENNINVCGYIDRKYDEIKEYNGIRVFDKSIIKDKKYFVYIGLEGTYEDVINYMNYNGYIEFEDYWYPKRQIVLDGSRSYIDKYGNSYKTEQGYNIKVVLYDEGHVQIGKDCVFGDEILIQSGEGGSIFIGNNCWFGSYENFDVLDKSSLQIGDNCSFEDGAKFNAFNGGKIKIGDNCRVRYGGFIVARCFGNLTIGNKVSFDCRTRISAKVNDIIIKDNCMFSWNVSVLSSNGHGLFDIEKNKNISLKDDSIIINEHVWIGMNANILPCTEVGKGSMIGANSVVKGVFPNNCCIAGNPAKIIKNKIAWRGALCKEHTSYEDFAEFDYTNE